MGEPAVAGPDVEHPRDRGAVDVVGDDAPEEPGPSHLPRVAMGVPGARLGGTTFPQVHQSASGSKSDGGGSDEHDHRLAEVDEAGQVGAGRPSVRPGIDRHAEEVGVDERHEVRRALRFQPVDQASRTAADSSFCSGVRESKLATSTASGTSRQASMYPPVARWIWATASARGPNTMVGHRHVEVLVGEHVEAPPLQLVQQAEARAADVRGVAPPDHVAGVGPRCRADALDHGVVGRGGQRAHGTAQPLLGVVGVGERDRRRQRRHHRDAGRHRRDGHRPTARPARGGDAATTPPRSTAPRRPGPS